MATVKRVRAVKNGRLVSSVEDDTKWTRKKMAYTEPPRGVRILTDRASLSITEGREDCGFGPMLLGEADPIRACDQNYRRGILAPTITGQWSNYGAPSGTHTVVAISWQFVPDPAPEPTQL